MSMQRLAPLVVGCLPVLCGFEAARPSSRHLPRLFDELPFTSRPESQNHLLAVSIPPHALSLPRYLHVLR